MSSQLKWNQIFDIRNTKLWFTSDLHLFHANIIKLDGRPYADVNEMFNDIKEKWNSQVSPDDHIFILGDILWGSPKTGLINFNNNFNGHKHVILGNHDKEHNENFECFDTVDRLAKIVVTDGIKSKGITLCHYPMSSWDGTFRGEWQLFGHVHNNISLENHKHNQCNVGFPSEWGFNDKRWNIYSFNDVKSKIEYINSELDKLELDKKTL